MRTGTPESPSGVHHALEEYRSVRRGLEESVLPLATSVDGRRFRFQASLHGLALQVGGYAVLEDETGSRLGQITSLGMTEQESASLEQSPGEAATAMHSRLAVRIARGEGVVLDGDRRPFHDALARPAAPEEVARWTGRAKRERAGLQVGELALAAGVPHSLDAGGFGRHSFLCGQSGSGKTYALGVLLEQLLLETELRIVVLDPNSDFVRLREVRSDAEGSIGVRYPNVARRIAVRSGTKGEARVAVRFPTLPVATQAAVLRLDPIGDREEYAELEAVLAKERPDGLRELARSDSEEARQLLIRARNLRVDRWGIWSRPGEPSLLEDLGNRESRCVVVDLGSLATREEQAVTAHTVLESLWRRRAERQPVLIVIDEAHNVCPAHPADPITALATEEAVRIAGEGRKFGLYLLVVTQRPQKVHANVLSQCDNLVLMRMNSAADLDFVGEVFSAVPPGLLGRAEGFRQGEALVAGNISSHPALIRFGARITEEGGADVPSGWAARREPGERSD